MPGCRFLLWLQRLRYRGRSSNRPLVLDDERIFDRFVAGDTHLLDHDINERSFFAVLSDGGNIVDDLHAGSDFSEGGILSVEESVIMVADEELASGRIRIHGTSHG